MICPKCKELNQKSIVYCNGYFSTCAMGTTYYDEEGVYHSHDNNAYTHSYTCSKGHRIAVTNTNKCPSCNYGLSPEKVIVKDIESAGRTTDGSGIIALNDD